MNDGREINRALGASLGVQRAAFRRKLGGRIALIIALAAFAGAFAIVLA